MKLKMLVMDVDGTLTDGKIYTGENGEALKAFHVQDGYGIKHILPELKILPVIVTGRKSKITENRASELGITRIIQGVTDKMKILENLENEFNISAKDIAYIGDDLNDLDCLKHVGYSACPANAVEKVKSTVQYICKHVGGDGAVREYIDYLADKSR